MNNHHLLMQKTSNSYKKDKLLQEIFAKSFLSIVKFFLFCSHMQLFKAFTSASSGKNNAASFIRD